MIGRTELLGGTNLLGGIEIYPNGTETIVLGGTLTETIVLGGTLSNRPPKGVIRNVIVRRRRVIIKLQA